MVRGIVNNFKFLFFSLFSICMSAVSLYLASLCPAIYGAVFERMFTSRCLCAIIRKCACRPFHCIDVPPHRFLFCFAQLCTFCLLNV